MRTLIVASLLVLLAAVACATEPEPVATTVAATPSPTDTPETISISEAIAQGYTREEEPCSNRQQFPDLYSNVPHEELENGMCAFYYPPDDIATTEPTATTEPMATVAATPTPTATPEPTDTLMPSPTVEPTPMAEPTPTPMPPQYFIPLRPFERPMLITGVPASVGEYAKWCAYERHGSDIPLLGRRWTWQDALTSVIRRSASEWNRITPPNELRDFHAAMVAIQGWWLQYAESQDPDTEVDYAEAIRAFPMVDVGFDGSDIFIKSGLKGDVVIAENALPLPVFHELVKWECTYGPEPKPDA